MNVANNMRGHGHNRECSGDQECELCQSEHEEKRMAGVKKENERERERECG